MQWHRINEIDKDRYAYDLHIWNALDALCIGPHVIWK